VKRAPPGSGNLYTRVVSVGLGLELERDLAVRIAENVYWHGLAVAGFLPPDQSDLDHCPNFASQDDSAGIRFPFSHNNARLSNPMRLFGVELNQRGVIAGEGILGVHRNQAASADRRPPARDRTPEAGIACRISYWLRGLGRGCRDRIEKLAVSQQLRPDARVDDVASVLKKLSVDVLRNGGASLRRVDCYIHRRCLRNSHN